jgi:hypothetical protein
MSRNAALAASVTATGTSNRAANRITGSGNGFDNNIARSSMTVKTHTGPDDAVGTPAPTNEGANDAGGAGKTDLELENQTTWGLFNILLGTGWWDWDPDAQIPKLRP